MSNKLKVGINGFGRIGRLTFRALHAHHQQTVEVVAINDLMDAATNAHMLRHDSNYGAFNGCVEACNGALVVDDRSIAINAERDPAQIPWQDWGVQVVVESTGRFRVGEDARKHFHNSSTVKKVLISAPAKSKDVFTIVLGVNDECYDPKKHDVISNASCTTNGLAPVAKVLHEAFTIQRGILTTIHSYTASQRLVDTASENLRDARAAALNLVPAETGAAKAVGLVIPELKGKFTGISVRVPSPTVSLVDFTAILGKSATRDAINAAIREAAEGELKGKLGYTEEPLVSTDLRGNTHSSIFSALDTLVLPNDPGADPQTAPGNFIKVLSWYDNECGYSTRLADLCAFVAEKGL